MSLITITHTIGCDALGVARQVADGLKVELYDDSRLREEALRMGLHSEQLKGFREKPPDWLERMVSAKPDIDLNLMASVIYEAARLGQGVIIGHGSQMLLHDFGFAMHVLITAQEESRIHRLVHEMTLALEAARKLIHHSNKQKRGFFRYAFHKDWDDPTLYDVCVNPDKIGSGRAAQLIMEAARSPELKSCGTYALDALERLSQTRRIEAALMEMDLRHAGREPRCRKRVSHTSPACSTTTRTRAASRRSLEGFREWRRFNWMSRWCRSVTINKRRTS